MAGASRDCSSSVKPLGQPIELLPRLLDHLPLFGNLVGKLLDRLRLMGDRFLELGDAALFV
jgi:hypothetical protein